MMLTRRTILFVLPGSALAGCSISGPAASGRSRFVTEKAAVGEIRDVVPAVGTVRPANAVEVSAPVSGQVTRVAVNENDLVAEGDVLCTFDSRTSDLLVQEGAAAIESAGQSLAEATEAGRQYDRALANKRALFDAGYVSAAALKSAEGDVRRQQSVIARARSDLKSAHARSLRMQVDADSRVVRSPISGFVLRRAVEPGVRVTEGTREPLFVIAKNLDKVVVDAFVSQVDIRRLEGISTAQITSESLPGLSLAGSIVRIAREAKRDRTTASYRVEIAVDNPDSGLWPGMSVSVNFVRLDAGMVLRVPTRALYFVPTAYVPKLAEEDLEELRRLGGTSDPENLKNVELGMILARRRSRIFVLGSNGASARAVKIGAQTDDFVEVLDGLMAGEAVILDERKNGASG